MAIISLNVYTKLRIVFIKSLIYKEIQNNVELEHQDGYNQIHRLIKINFSIFKFIFKKLSFFCINYLNFIGKILISTLYRSWQHLYGLS